MNPTLVVDVGNSRIKWGRCQEGQISESVSLPADDPKTWQEQLGLWNLTGALSWIVTGVHPQRRDRLAEWLRQRGDSARILDDWQQLPLRVRVARPEWVGIDRLLNGVAASRRVRSGVPAVLVDAGSAVTVDWLDESGAFAGGAIFPGLRLMTQALHDYTALLPLVPIQQPAPPVPATSTPAAVEAGVYWAVVGGMQALIGRLGSRATVAPEVFLTGGDAALLAPALNPDVHLWPHMTLEGIRIAAETLP
jgi:type III pantothenate kinase